MEHYQQLEAHFAKINHLEQLAAVSEWDEQVMMPPGAGASRAATLASLHHLIHEFVCDAKVGEWIAGAKEETLDNPWQQSNLYWIERRYTMASCVPADLVKAQTETALLCQQAWRDLRPQNNWHDFEPLLAKSFALTKEIATIRAQTLNEDPYDVCIGEFSPGLNQANINPLFKALKTQIPQLLPTILEKQAQWHIKEPKGPFPLDKQKQLGINMMQAIGFDFNHGRLDISHHPFCGGTPEDVRLTTRYNENEFISALMGTCHETGHAKYEQQLPREWLLQPVGRALGMATHESQSLLIEMQACRSSAFMTYLTPLLCEQFGKHSAFTIENMTHIYQTVKPGYIRVDADEVTYPLHVILRYELEQALFQDQLTIAELPEAWHEKMQDYLSLSTQGDYKNGVMQDVHWPCGLFGYFPAYTIGALIAAQLFHFIRQDLPSIDQELSTGNFKPLMQWLKEKIHSQASLYHSSDELLKAATGEPLQAKYFLAHLQARYLTN